MARRKKVNGPHVYWRGARAYGDFRSYADVGGGREPLAVAGTKWGTTDTEIAGALFAARLAELDAKRRGAVGVPTKRSTTLAELVRDHLLMKAKAGRTSDGHLEDLEQRLTVALDFFGRGRDPRTLDPSDVRAWGEQLATSGRRKPGTVRHYLNALSGLYGRAQEGLYVDPGYNPVAMLTEKPSGWSGRGEAAFFEASEAALILEAARILDAKERAAPGTTENRVNAVQGFYPIVAAMLLTGGRNAEVLGLDVEDVSFDRGLVRFRPNAHRGLKTKTSVRDVPLWPQLRGILQAWMFGGDTPRTSGLLFPSATGAMVGDMRKSLDTVGRMCGLDAGEVRTRRFRHTYCSARLQTVQRIVKPGVDPATDPDPYTFVETSKFTVQKEMGHGGAQLVDRIYGHGQRNPHRSEVVEYRVEKHAKELGARLTALAAAGREH
ncbi:MAG TPA: tyrosine-type recombinase/integrase [Longimicrobiales bacterium]|nr:tyrosine-type recombinase/integrase [Longimicrobiales bacterium]